MKDVGLFFSISIDRTDLCRIFRLGTEPQLGTISLTLVFQFLNGRFRGNRFSLILSTEIDTMCISVVLLVLSAELIHWTQVASGAVGRANVGLCRAKSLL